MQITIQLDDELSRRLADEVEVARAEGQDVDVTDVVTALIAEALD